MATNETVIRAVVTLDASQMQRVPAAFSPATAAANQFGQAAQRAGVAMDTLGTKAQRALRFASRARGIVSSVGNVVSSVVGTEGKTGGTVSGAIEGGAQGAYIGSPAGPWGAAAVGVAGAIWGGYKGFTGAGAQEDAARAAAMKENTQALIEVMRELQELRVAQEGMQDAQGRAKLAEVIREYTMQAKQLMENGASAQEATAVLDRETYLEGIEALKASGEKNAEEMSRKVAGTVATVAQSAEILKTQNRYLGGGTN